VSRPRHPLRGPLVEFILGGGTVKEFAFDRGLNVSNVARLLYATGLRKYFLTPAEHAAVKAQRAQGRKVAA
jgi:hypothetical protein